MAVRQIEPIDRAELRATIQKWIDAHTDVDDTDGVGLLEDVLWEINAQPTLTPQNEWVRVENAFPPKNESVLCIVSGKPKPNITLKDAYQLGSWNKADGWIIDEWLDWEGANVTWWMKLPETPDRRPPEGEEDI